MLSPQYHNWEVDLSNNIATCINLSGPCTFSDHFRQMQDTRAMADDNDDNLLTHNLLCFKLDETDDWWSIASSNNVNDSSSVLSPLAHERIILQPNTILQRPTVRSERYQ